MMSGQSNEPPVTPSSEAAPGAAPTEPATPPEEARLIAKFTKCLGAQLGQVEKNVSSKIDSRMNRLDTKFEELDGDFVKLTKNVQRHNELARENSKKLEKLAADQQSLATEVRQNRQHDQNEMMNFRSHLGEMDKQIEGFKIHQLNNDAKISEKVNEMEKLIKQFKTSNFGANNQPTPRDLFLMKKYYNISLNAIGFFPVEPEDLDMIAANNQGINRINMYRVAVFDYLTLEMMFTPEWVKALEAHYVSFIYDNVNTLYLVVDDLDQSGARQIWQESPILRTGEARQTRELRRLEVPQFRARLKGMDTVAGKYRFNFNDAHKNDNVKVRTRIVEHKDPSIFDYVLQHKFTDESWGPTKYTTIPWPDWSKDMIPQIQWKITNYIQHDVAKLRPARDRSARPTGAVPTGRNRRSTQSVDMSEVRQRASFSMQMLDEAHNFVPGVIEPTEENPDGEERELLRTRSRDQHRLIPDRNASHTGSRLNSRDSEADSQSSITSQMELSPAARACTSKPITFPSPKQNKYFSYNVDVFAPHVKPQSVKQPRQPAIDNLSNLSDTNNDSDVGGEKEKGETGSNSDQSQAPADAQVLQPPLLPDILPRPSQEPRLRLVARVRESERDVRLNIITDVDDFDDNGNRANIHGPITGPEAPANLWDDTFALDIPAPPSQPQSTSDSMADTQEVNETRAEEQPVDQNIDMDSDGELEVFEDAFDLNKTAEIILPPGGPNDTILSGTQETEQVMSSTDPGMSQSIIHRPSSTLAPSMIDCDHTSVNETENDSFLDPENKFELGEATLKETAALAEANALSRENREFQAARSQSPPINCSNPGQTSYPTLEATPGPSSPAILTPAGSSNPVKMVQKTLFGEVAIPATGVKTPRSSRLKVKVNSASKATKERQEQLEKYVTKRKCDEMARDANKLSPPDKAEKKTEIVREYDEEEVNRQEPDRPATPPPDATGHITTVIAVTPNMKVNSEPPAETKKE